MIQTDEHADINLDFQRARDLVAEPHRRVDFWLGVALAFLSCLFLYPSFVLFRLYQTSGEYLQLYGHELTVQEFIRQNVSLVAAASNIERQRDAMTQQRKQELLASLLQDLQKELRTALPRISDESLGRKIEECLNAQLPDLD